MQHRGACFFVAYFDSGCSTTAATSFPPSGVVAASAHSRQTTSCLPSIQRISVTPASRKSNQRTRHIGHFQNSATSVPVAVARAGSERAKRVPAAVFAEIATNSDGHRAITRVGNPAGLLLGIGDPFVERLTSHDETTCCSRDGRRARALATNGALARRPIRCGGRSTARR